MDNPDEALDDGFAYEHVGGSVHTDLGLLFTPTPFMLVSLKEVLSRVRAIYGLHGHWLCNEIGAKRMRDTDWIDGLSLTMYWRLHDAAVAALPEDEREAFA